MASCCLISPEVFCVARVELMLPEPNPETPASRVWPSFTKVEVTRQAENERVTLVFLIGMNNNRRCVETFLYCVLCCSSCLLRRAMALRR